MKELHSSVKRNVGQKKRGENKGKENSRRQGKESDVITTISTSGDAIAVTDRYRTTVER